jgi:protein-tyrosine phosphatase
MIDIHTHILPGIDDGPVDLEESLAVARLAVADGTRHMIATPHNGDWEQIGSDDQLSERVQSLQAALDEAGIDLRVYPGSEVHVTPDLAQRWQTGQVIALNRSRYVLIELPFFMYPHYLDQLFFELEVEGAMPVLAHAERYRDVQEHPEILVPLVERGVLIQITSTSLLGFFGREAKKTAAYLLRRGLAHVIASDGHNTDSRPPLLAEGVAVAAEYVGDGAARKMVTETPRAILHDEPIAVEPPQPAPPARRWFGRW